MGAIWVNRPASRRTTSCTARTAAEQIRQPRKFWFRAILGDDAHQEAGQRHAEDQQAAAARVGQRPEQPHRQSKAGAGKGPLQHRHGGDRQRQKGGSDPQQGIAAETKASSTQMGKSPRA